MLGQPSEVQFFRTVLRDMVTFKPRTETHLVVEIPEPPEVDGRLHSKLDSTVELLNQPSKIGVYLITESHQLQYLPSVQTNDRYPRGTSSEAVWLDNASRAGKVTSATFTLGIFPNYPGSDWAYPKVFNVSDSCPDSERFATVHFISVDEWGSQRDSRPLAKLQVHLPRPGRYMIEDPVNDTWTETYMAFVEW
jgi:hypothetical protein